MSKKGKTVKVAGCEVTFTSAEWAMVIRQAKERAIETTRRQVEVAIVKAAREIQRKPAWVKELKQLAEEVLEEAMDEYLKNLRKDWKKNPPMLELC